MKLFRIFGKGGKEKPILLDTESYTTDIYIELLNPDMCISVDGSKELAVALLRSAAYAQEKAYGIVQEKQDISRQAVFVASRLYSLANTAAVPYTKDGQSLFVEYFEDKETSDKRITGRYYRDENLEIPVDKEQVRWQCPYLEFPLFAEFAMDKLWKQYEILNLLSDASNLSKEEQKLLEDNCIDALRGLVTDIFTVLHPLTSMYATGLFTKTFVTEQSNVSEVDPGKEHKFECKQNTESSLFLKLFLQKMQKYYRKRGLCLRIFHYPQYSHRYQWEKSRHKVYETFQKKKDIDNGRKTVKSLGVAESCLRPMRSRFYFPFPAEASKTGEKECHEDDSNQENNEKQTENRKERIQLNEEERKTLLLKKKKQIQKDLSSQSENGHYQPNIGVLTYQHVYDSTAFMVILNTPPEALPNVKVPRQVILTQDREETQKRTHKL